MVVAIAPPQSLLQNVVRLAAQNAALPRLLAELRSVRLSCETLNVMLSESTRVDDKAAFGTAVSLGRAASVHFNTVTFCLLLSNALSKDEIDQLLTMAASPPYDGAGTRGVLIKAAELALQKRDAVLADAVRRHLPVCPHELVKNHIGAVFALIRFAADVSDHRARSEADSDLLELYEADFGCPDLSSNVEVEQCVLDAALRCQSSSLPALKQRADRVVVHLMAGPSEDTRRTTAFRSLHMRRQFKDALSFLQSHPCSASSLYTELVGACVDAGDLDMAERSLQLASQLGKASEGAYNKLLKEYLQRDDILKVRTTVRAMQDAGLEAKVATFNEFFNAAVKGSRN